MSGGRDKILGAVRRGLGREALSQGVRDTLDARLRGDRADTALRPRLDAQSAWSAFRSRLEAAAGTWETLDDDAAVPHRVAGYLDARGLTGPLAVAPALAGLDWASAGIAPHVGRSHGAEGVAVSRAFCAIAETGSVVLLSGPDNPTTLNFLPDHHLVVVDARDLVMHIEDAWSRLRLAPAGMPRAVNLITGPSRTADVEQTIQLGAHGPRSLHLLFTGCGD